MTGNETLNQRSDATVQYALNQHLAALRLACAEVVQGGKSYFIREASLSDIHQIMLLEEESWLEPLRYSREVLMGRLTGGGTTHIFVLVMSVHTNDELHGTGSFAEARLLGAIQTQIIHDLQDVVDADWKAEDSSRSHEGGILQLLRVSTLRKTMPDEAKAIPVGFLLRNFCLHYAWYLGMTTACAVTRTSSYKDHTSLPPFQDYVQERNGRGESPDPGLNFHIARGAQVHRLLAEWRPQDGDNLGHGVLVQYDLRDVLTSSMIFTDVRDSERVSGPTPVAFDDTPEERKKEILLAFRDVLRSLDGLENLEVQMEKPLMEMGLDSLLLLQFVRQVSQKMRLSLSPTVVFDCPTLDSLADHVNDTSVDRKSQELADGRDGTQAPTQQFEAQSSGMRCSPVGITGVAGRFAGGISNLRRLWEVCKKAHVVVSQVPFSRWDMDAEEAWEVGVPADVKIRSRYGGFLEDLEWFDAVRFSVSSDEAMMMDPQHRIVLELALVAFEDSGSKRKELKGMNIGVFLGIMNSDSQQMSHKSSISRSVYVANSSSHSTAAGRISHVFGLEGPCVAYDTACSSSLVALHAGSTSLQVQGCTACLVLGVNAILSSVTGKAFGIAGMTSPTGRCHTFDECADGYVRAEGCAAVVLEAMREQNIGTGRMYGMVHAVSVAHDGQSASLMAPNGRAQVKLIKSAMVAAQVDSEQVGYFEAHGTGTKLGDPIEMNALSETLNSIIHQGDVRVPVGGVKANIGHSESTAGLAGLLKVMLVLQLNEAPPNAALKVLNPKISSVTEGGFLTFPQAL